MMNIPTETPAAKRQAPMNERTNSVLALVYLNAVENVADDPIGCQKQFFEHLLPSVGCPATRYQIELHLDNLQAVFKSSRSITDRYKELAWMEDPEELEPKREVYIIYANAVANVLDLSLVNQIRLFRALKGCCGVDEIKAKLAAHAVLLEEALNSYKTIRELIHETFLTFINTHPHK
jgi:hypothetical protein